MAQTNSALVRQVIAATYHQVWWPAADTPVYIREDELPVWDEEGDALDLAGMPTTEGAGYLDPTTAAILPTWEEALDDLDTDDDLEPQHVVRFGTQSDIQGLLAGSPDADRRVGYLAKYLTKSMGTAHGADAEAAVTPTSIASSPPCATSRAPRAAQTGCATASSLRMPAPA